MVMALSARAWTLAELDRLPEDGNTYELIDGELFVTPAPMPAHEQLSSVLLKLLAPFVWGQRLGHIYTPHAVIQKAGSQVEPDLMVRPAFAELPNSWLEMPPPVLVVEILSRTTERRDREQKRRFYLRSGVSEYWMVDRWRRCVHVVRPNTDDVIAETVLEWQPTGADDTLLIDVAAYFDEAIGPRDRAV